MLRVAGRRLIMLLRIRLIKRWVVVIIFSFSFFFLRGDWFVCWLPTYSFLGGNHRINNFDISYKQENSIHVFLTKNSLKNEERKNARKTTPTNCKQKCSVLYLFFFSFLSLSLFLSFLTQCCWSFSCWLRICIYSMSQGPEGGGGSFRMQSLMMTLWIYKYIYRRPWRSRRQAQPPQALLSTCDRWDHYRDCGQAGKEKLFFYFFGLRPYFEWGASRRGREGCWHAYTHIHIHIHIRQPVSCEDWSLTAPSGMCMYVCVCMCGTMQKW